MNEKLELDADRAVYLELIYLAFIEIRALKDENLEYARAISDVMHNIPGLLLSGATNGEIKDVINKKAKWYGLEKWVSAHQKSAEKLTSKRFAKP